MNKGWRNNPQWLRIIDTNGRMAQCRLCRDWDVIQVESEFKAQVIAEGIRQQTEFIWLRGK